MSDWPDTDLKNDPQRITLRLESSLFHDLKQQASAKNISINNLLKNILNDSLIYLPRANVLPSISMSHMMFEKIICKIDDVTLQKLASDGYAVARRYFSLINKDYSIDNVIDDYFSVLTKYSCWFVFRYTKKDNFYRLVFELPMGEKWRVFLISYIRSILEKCNVLIDSESIEDNLIIFNVRKILKK